MSAKLGWLTKSLQSYLETDYQQAKFLLIGQGEIQAGKDGEGIFCATNDVFTAYRARKEIQKNPKNQVEIVPNSPEVLVLISEILHERLAVMNSNSVPAE